MSRRFTETEKWSKSWFRDLSIESKLLYLFIHDNCDIAGFLEIDLKIISFVVGLPADKDSVGLLENCKPQNSSIEAALKPLASLCFRTGNILWLKDFLFEQKNLPLNPANQCHKGILARINSHGLLKEQIFNEIEKIQKEQGLDSPLGNGIGNSNSKKGIVKGVEEKAECFIDHEKAFGRGHVVHTKSGKDIRIFLCPKCNDVFCELVKDKKILTGKTTLAEIENKVQKARKQKDRTEGEIKETQK